MTQKQNPSLNTRRNKWSWILCSWW